MAPDFKAPADQSERDAAIAERKRNVLIDAGAGTGKTTLLANRLVEMVAPLNSKATPIPIDRLAAITFTRKAAGELRLRVRERLLAGLAQCDPSTPRAALLRDALAGLDTAHISTIHSFCDRLLRLRPVEAHLSPSYEIAEEPDGLVAETFAVLLESAEAGKLATLLAGTTGAEFSVEAQQTLLDALRAGIRRDTKEHEWVPKLGLAALIEAFVLQRDVPFKLPKAPTFDAAAFQGAAQEFLDEAAGIEQVDTAGTRWIRRLAQALKALKRVDDPVEIWTTLDGLTRGPIWSRGDTRKKNEFPDADQAWRLWNLYLKGNPKEDPPQLSLEKRLLAPLHQWMALRLVRLFPVVTELYGQVKARRRQLDQIDLLLRLRDLLANDKETRGYYQSLFDHLFVDEFQDTDPLQAEVVLFLCEAEPKAARWDRVVLQPGKLTLVGDPKQSIYRFRRADIAVYEQVRQHVSSTACLSVTLSTNFRSAAQLIAWVNDRFAAILGVTDPTQPLFDAEEGTVRYQPLEPGPHADRSKQARVLALPLAISESEEGLAGDYRRLEATALARGLRQLVEAGTTQVLDPIDGQKRPLQYGDIAVLAISTWELDLLFPEFDRYGVPFASRGGTLLLQDPLHRQFILALRGVADRDDGPAQASLFRAPFFAVDLIDLLHERAQSAAERGDPLPGVVDAERAQRASEAVRLVAELRAARLSRPVGATARDLLERTAFGRSMATGPNGEQRLDRVHEVIRAIESLAAAEGLDFDGATERARAWIETPTQLDAPHPVGSEAVQVLTVHQAKGLEFPVVVLWDGMARWTGADRGGAFRVSRDGSAWTLAIDGLVWEHPEGSDIAGHEERFRNAERKRVVYVAATRARDLFICASPAITKAGGHISHDLLADESGKLVNRLEPYSSDSLPAWASDVEEAPEVVVATPRSKALRAAQAEELSHATQWATRAAASSVRHLVPTSVTQVAHEADEAAFKRSRAAEFVAADDPAPPRPKRESRFGKRFGDTVHRAIGVVLRQPSISEREAVARAAMLVGLTEHLDEAVADVTRTVASLRLAGLAGPGTQVEYPVWSTASGEALVQGFIDLLGQGDDGLVVVDFKTDAPPREAVELERPAYVQQVRTYRDLLEQAGVRGVGRTRCALLFTVDGLLRWC